MKWGGGPSDGTHLDHAAEVLRQEVVRAVHGIALAPAAGGCATSGEHPVSTTRPHPRTHAASPLARVSCAPAAAPTPVCLALWRCKRSETPNPANAEAHSDDAGVQLAAASYGPHPTVRTVSVASAVPPPTAFAPTRWLVVSRGHAYTHGGGGVHGSSDARWTRLVHAVRPPTAPLMRTALPHAHTKPHPFPPRAHTPSLGTPPCDRIIACLSPFYFSRTLARA